MEAEGEDEGKQAQRGREGRDAVLFANGILVSAARAAAEQLASDGIDITVADLHTIQPFDVEGVLSLVENVRHVFVAEEHNTRSGVATAVADALVDAEVGGKKLTRIGFPPDEYSVIAAPYYLYKYYGLDADGVANRIRKVLSE